MTRRMLINGRHAEELRMAIVEEDGPAAEGSRAASRQILESYKVQMDVEGVERGNVYRGVVANIEPSLDAAFIDYGNDRHGFLARHDVVPEACHRPGGEGSEEPLGCRRAPDHLPLPPSRIEEVLERGQPILVQVTRDALAQKGAVLTTNISLPGRYLVLMPYDEARGMSRKVEDEAVRRRLRQKVSSLVSDGFGFIVRTNAVDQTKTALKHDFDQLVRLWKRILEAFSQGQGPCLLYNDQDLIVQALRDQLDADIDEIVVDDERLLERAAAYLEEVMPSGGCKLTLYRDRIPLFSRYNLEPQVAAVYRRVVSLPGGGSIVIDPCEALTAIDVNSGKSTSGGSQEETAFSCNLEAAAEVARQLRLRDIGGLVVVDFIDMRSPKQRREVERAVKEAMKRDKARTHVGRISSNGLLEINRQRIQQAIGVRAHRLCPACQGSGRLLSAELQALHLLRRLEAGAATGRMRRVRVALHPAMAEMVQNLRRAQLAALEAELKLEIEIVGDPLLAHGEERLQWSEREPVAARQEPPASAGAPRAAGAAAEVGAPRGPARPPAAGGRGAAGQAAETGRSRRRRRRGRRTLAQAAEPLVAGQPPVAEAASATTGSATTGSAATGSGSSAGAGPAGAAPGRAPGEEGRRRRRRRGGRRRQGGAVAPAPAD